MGNVLLLGMGGVGSVVAHKAARLPEVFESITLASRRIASCEAVKKSIGRADIKTAAVDADDVAATRALIEKSGAALVVNTALPYQDLTLMEACLQAGVDYLDTANYEHPDRPGFEYKEQWAYHDRFAEKGLMALLGCGFDPGATNVFIAHMKKHHFAAMRHIDILDANGGDHGLPFATNFNLEINLREITQRGKYYEGGEWKETDPLSIHEPFDFPGVGEREKFLIYHEEMESLVKNFPEIERIRFWMTFGASYLKHLEVLQNVGMTRIDPVTVDGVEVIPIRVLQAVMPNPADLGPMTKGKTCIGCVIDGTGKDGNPKKMFTYNICDHEESYADVGSQAISFTTGVPAMIGAKMMLTGAWRGAGVFNVEQFDPDPFMADMNAYGLPWVETDL
jgi:saccharopine dehydrogenase (NAD+, L-lysine-forming)